MSNKILIPLIRKLTPKLIADEIVGVQPMTTSVDSIFDMYNKDKKDQVLIGYSPEYDQPYWAQPELGGLFSRRQQRYEEIDEWVKKTFGESNEGWKNPRWSASNRKYWFKYEKDRTLFVMRWS